MKALRKPYQIILIEHLFYPILGFIFLVLGAIYGPKVAEIHSGLQSDDIREITVAIGITILGLVSLIAFPYSCSRLWKSSDIHLQGFWKGLSKAYAVFLLGACLIYGVLILISLPSVYIAAWSI